MSDELDIEQHEERDVNFRALAIAAVALVIMAIIIHVLIALLLGWLAVDRGLPDPSPNVPEFPEPALQVVPAADWQAYRAEQIEQLNAYGWIGAEGGIARIPIERAMAILEERGEPAWAGSASGGEAGVETEGAGAGDETGETEP